MLISPSIPTAKTGVMVSIDVLLPFSLPGSPRKASGRRDDTTIEAIEGK